MTATPQQLGPVILDMGIMMLKSGASSHRISIVMSRVTAAYGCVAHMDIQPKSFALTLEMESEGTAFHGMRRTQDYGVNFTVLSGISTLSFELGEKQLTPQALRDELDRMSSIPHYPRWLILVMVAMAGAGFCYTFGGNMMEMGIAFVATFSGLFTKQEMVKRSFNHYVCTFVSALVAALTIAVFYRLGFDLPMQHAYATCVLFLIPGVHLINFFIDLVAGNILYGIERGVNALIHTFAIALGLAMAITLHQL